MQGIEIIKIIKRYAKKLKENNFSFDAIYLFGSFSKKMPNEWSDIDIAVISDDLKKNHRKKRLLLWKFTEGIDLRIEPVGFTIEEFNDFNDPFVNEIRKYGYRVV